MLKNVSLGSLGFSSGLPYILIFSTLGVWLRDIGIELTLIGFFAWIVLTYSLKFLWAPIVDNFSIPVLNKMGSRKSWIYPLKKESNGHPAQLQRHRVQL